MKLEKELNALHIGGPRDSPNGPTLRDPLKEPRELLDTDARQRASLCRKRSIHFPSLSGSRRIPTFLPVHLRLVLLARAFLAVVRPNFSVNQIPARAP